MPGGHARSYDPTDTHLPGLMEPYIRPHAALQGAFRSPAPYSAPPRDGWTRSQHTPEGPVHTPRTRFPFFPVPVGRPLVTAPNSCLFEHAIKCTGCQVAGQFSRDGDPAFFDRMLELTMRTSLGNEHPAVRLNQLDNRPDLHIARQCIRFATWQGQSTQANPGGDRGLSGPFVQAASGRRRHGRR
jgi:hypothetical protein